MGSCSGKRGRRHFLDTLCSAKSDWRGHVRRLDESPRRGSGPFFISPGADTAPEKQFFFKHRYYVTLEALLMYPDGARATGSVNEVFWGEWNPSKQERRLSTKVLIGFPLSNSVSSISILKAEGKLAAFRDNDLYGIERLFHPEKISWSFQSPPPVRLLSDASP